jgi:hypothetical protein
MGFLDNAIASNGIRLTEAAPYFASNDPDRDYDIQHGMRKITGKENERDLTPLEQQRMIEIAHWLYDSNPLAKRIIDLINSFVTGDGFNFTAKHPDVLQVMKDFWYDPINDWPLKQLDRFRQLSLYGEQLYPVFVRRSDGRVRLGYVDPANIEEIVPKPTNPEVVEWAITRTGYTVDNSVIPKKYSLIQVDEYPLSQTFGKLTWDAGPDGKTDGAFYFAINKPSNATRGRSDLVTIFDWLDLYDQ